MLTYSQDIPDNHIPKPNVYPIKNDSFLELSSSKNNKLKMDKIDKNQRSKGAKPNEKINPHIRARTVFLNI